MTTILKKIALPCLVILLTAFLAVQTACGSGSSGEEQAASAEQSAQQGDPARGEQTYEEVCSSCHGSGGTGGFAPSHVDCGMCDDYSELLTKIDEDMPKGDSGACTGGCAADTAAYIYIELNGNEL